jgi:hypothetical protein
MPIMDGSAEPDDAQSQRNPWGRDGQVTRDAGQDRALVMDAILSLVARGHAKSSVLADGDIEIRFWTGETFVLRSDTVIRLS